MGRVIVPLRVFPDIETLGLAALLSVQPASWSRSLIERSEIVTFENSAFDEVPEVPARE